MWRLCVRAMFIVLITGCSSEQPDIAMSEIEVIVEYANANWYENGRFVRRSGFVENGDFVEAPTDGADSVVDLGNKYIVPGFAEAHHHTVLCDAERIEQFLDAGIVYVAIMNARVSSRTCQSQMHGQDTLEVTSALAGLTARNAHPFQIGLYFLEEDEIDGEWVHYVDSMSDLDSVWPRILQSAPDVLKIFLSYTENYAQLHEDKSLASWYRGLDPMLAAPIVSRAHDAGLRVVAHVMSAHDFQVAVEAGVDFIGHMPGFAPGAAFTEDDTHPWLSMLAAQPEHYLITPTVAAMAGEREIAVITTVSGSGEPTEAIISNFNVLGEAGVTLLIGSDRGEFNSVDEATYLVDRNLLSPAGALHSLAVTTPQHLFPQRNIGNLAVGSEATFVVLPLQPVTNFDAIRQVEWVIKRGIVLRSPN
jgi:imidazolonepropionase-like amidohydrolase